MATTIESFWVAVHQTAQHRDGLLHGWDSGLHDGYDVFPLKTDLNGTVVLMARTVMQVTMTRLLEVAEIVHCMYVGTRICTHVYS